MITANIEAKDYYEGKLNEERTARQGGESANQHTIASLQKEINTLREKVLT